MLTALHPKCYLSDLGKLYYLDSECTHAETIVFLHGFTGSSRDFFTLPEDIVFRYRCLIPDLPGHGQTQILEAAASFQTDGQVALLEQWLNALGQKKIHLFGYSMGGRLALQYAVKQPQNLLSLILVSTTAGIREASDRSNRITADLQLADRILTSDPIEFLTAWLTQPLFQGIAAQGHDKLMQEIKRRLPLQLSGLAHSLRYFSTGAMPSVWHDLSRLQIPTLVVAGSRDPKYCGLADQLVAAIPKATLQILETSHAPLVESPTLLWRHVSEFLGST